MKKWTRTAAQAALATYAVVGAGAGIASADTHTNGNFSLLGGNQGNAPISVPISVSGDAITAGGFAAAASKGGAFVHNSGAFSGEWHTTGKYSAGGGNQVDLPLSAPIYACGDAISGAGIGKAACKGSAVVINRNGSGKWKASGKGSLLGGNQLYVPGSAPVNLCGNAGSAAGISKAACNGSAVVLNGHKQTGSSFSMGGRFSRILFAAPARRGQPEPPAPGQTGNMLPPLLQGITGTTSPIVSSDIPALPGNGPISVGSPLDSLTKPGATGATGATGGSAPAVIGGLLGTAK